MQTLPWWTKGAVEFIEANIRPNDTVFEWGTGGSTVWLNERANVVVSVEHDPGYYMDCPVRGNLLYLPPDREFQPGYEGAVPKGKSFRGYSHVIDSFAPVDWVIIDGRARVACARQAVKKFKRFLVLDDAYRERYSEITGIMAGHEMLTFPGPFAYGKGEGETRIWRYIHQQ